MNRLERKCLVASSGLHAFLALLVVFGTAFFTAKKPEKIPPMLNVVPSILIDEALAGGGGNPRLPRTDEKIKGDTLRPTSSPPEPMPEPPKTRRQETRTEVPPPAPEPPKVTPKVTKQPVKPKVDEPTKPRIDISQLKPIRQPDTSKQKEKEKEEAEARARERAREFVREAAQAAARERARKAAAISSQLQKEINSAASRLKSGFTSGTQVDVGGPGGAAFANYKSFVQMAYENAWVITPELTDEDFIALIKVTVARDGRILASRIVKPSGSATMDRTVQKAMDRVRADGLPPFPQGAPDSERTFTIEFNLKAKSRIG